MVPFQFSRRDFLRYQSFLLGAGLLLKPSLLWAHDFEMSLDDELIRPTAVPIPEILQYPDPIQREWPRQKTPDFRRVKNHVAGVRPYRETGFRLQTERWGTDKLIIHNYGHGGAGMTLSWAVAELAVEKLISELPNSRVPVAVMGGGVIGLSTAFVLLEKGFPVTLYSEKFHPNITSSVAGGQFSPSVVKIPSNLSLNNLLLRSWRRFAPLDEQGAGVSYVPNFMQSSGSSFDRFPPGTIPGGRSYSLNQLPFQGPARRGSYAWTFLIEPPIYLPWLTTQITRKGAIIKSRKFSSRNEVAELPEKVVVNCLGLGAKYLFQDNSMNGMRGQIVQLEPQNLGYLLSIRGGYIFSRQDSVVLGGTFESGVETPTTTPAGYERIMNVNRRFFGV